MPAGTNTAPDAIDERSVTVTIPDADVTWIDENKDTSQSGVVQLLSNGWIRIIHNSDPNEYHPPNSVRVVTPQGE